jgi:ketopantoate reductase
VDRVAEYRQILIRILTEYAAYKPSYGEVEVEAIFDEAKDHYEIIYAGWNRRTRVHGSIIHIDIREGKVWIQHDGTEDGIANELIEAGVPKQHIVLAWHDPGVRKHTGFATG